MGLRINQNIAAFNSYRNLSVTDGQMSKSLEKLSSGFRINRAADDAAGLVISEGLRSQVGGLKTAVRNAQDGVSVVQTAEGALTEVHSILQRMRDLSVQAANSGSQDTDARKAAQAEFGQLNEELDRIGSTTKFGNQKLLDGSFGAGFKAAAGTTTDYSTAAQATAAAGFSFDITDLNGQTLGTAITVTVPAQSATNTPTDTAAAINDAIKTALKGVAGANYQGNEVSVQATVDPQGNGATFSMTGTQAFTVDDTGGFFADAGLASTTGVANPAGNSGAFQVGANSGEKLNIAISAISATSLGTKSLDLVGDASGAITALDKAITDTSSQRATLGAYQNRFEHAINNLNVAVENLSASESRIRDTDMASEMVSFTRAQILSQAGTSMLAQANQAPQSILKLLG